MRPVEPVPILSQASRTLGVGRIEATRAEETVMLPLARVSMKARVAGRVACTTVTQEFRNPFDAPIEAVYIFPLPGGCVVRDCELRVGKRVVKAAMKERQEARAAYRQAIQEGKRASLTEQERDDVFTMTVGNVLPDETVTVVVETAERLPYFDDGMTELRLPVVVAPRYIAGTPADGEPTGDGVESDTDQVPDASRITPPRLAEGFDPKVALSIEVEVDTQGEELRDVGCTQHAVRASLGTDAVSVRLSDQHEPLDRDFVLRWRVAAASLRTTCMAFTDHRGRRFAMLNVVPPRRDGFLGLARDVVFVLDHSGSMEGIKMASAARACSMLLQTLGPRDRFAILAFDNRFEWLGEWPERVVITPRVKANIVTQGKGGVTDDGEDVVFVKGQSIPGHLVPATDEWIRRGEALLRKVQADGGTELRPALHEALDALGRRRETAGRAPVVVVLTDGEVGDESGILKVLQKDLRDCRLFTVGIDTAVNSGFLRRLAALGGGTASFVTPGGDLEDALRGVGREIGQSLVTDLAIAGDGAEAGSLAPSRIPDLFAGRAAGAFFVPSGARTVRVTGRFADGRTFDETVPVRDTAQPALASLWARARVADLEDRFRMHPEEATDLRAQIVRIACEHNILTKFTAFVAVDHAEVVNATGEVRHIVQPVEQPAKWEMEERQRRAASGQVAASIGGDLRCSMAGPAEANLLPPQKDASAISTESLHFDDADEKRPVPSKPASKAKKLSGGVFHPKAPAPPAGGSISSRPGRRGEEPEPFSDGDRKAFTLALEAFAKALAAARAEAKAGRVPQTDVLEEAREALVKVLAGSPIAPEVPLLQRFLRQSAIELVAACATEGATAAGLHEMFEHHAKLFEAALKESDAALAGRRGAPWWAFWEKTV